MKLSCKPDSQFRGKFSSGRVVLLCFTDYTPASTHASQIHEKTWSWSVSWSWSWSDQNSYPQERDSGGGVNPTPPHRTPLPHIVPAKLLPAVRWEFVAKFLKTF